ncbi:uncharacterized protein V1510DRAFT_420829 [Dipodascopsis tothii]|uniref:uncharacterized protein n=1 Tax=Dipodascopsis tothii TaxID=44089 RepID=UPI0034CFACFF
MVAYAGANSTLNDSSIAYISCDGAGASANVARAFDLNPQCIVLYSETAKLCELLTSALSSDNIGAVFSTVSTSAARAIKNAILAYPGVAAGAVMVNQTRILDTAETATGSTTTATATTTATPIVIVGSATTVTVTPTQQTAAATSTAAAAAKSGNGSTTVAMLILYSITGIITGLFLVVIILGAIRAHRHPERYQVMTTPDGNVQRTSRAHGLAKAVLDSIPLVRVPMPAARSPTLAGDDDSKIKMVDLDATGRVAAAARRASVSTHTSETTHTAVAVDAADFSADDCPICFESFEPGQQLRVLPCNHRFHVDCVDPWLLNSSSQCPLCRIDLSLLAKSSTDSADTEQEYAAVPAVESSRLNRLLDMWNAQLLPREERRIAMEILRDEARVRREQRRTHGLHSFSNTFGLQRTAPIQHDEATRTRWRRFIDDRLRQQRREATTGMAPAAAAAGATDGSASASASASVPATPASASAAPAPAPAAPAPGATNAPAQPPTAP